MQRTRIVSGTCLAAMVWLCAGIGAEAQTAPRVAPAAAAPTPDPAFEAARLAFEALPLAERRAVQDALVWTGDFQGVTSGTFGKRTQDGINTYATRLKLPANGTLDSAARAGLMQAAQQAKQALKFEIISEKRAGVSIGIPGKILSKATPITTGQRFAAPDNSASVETSTISGAEADLPLQFERLKADAPGRKVTYKLLRPDFMVVTGEGNGQSFYTRLALTSQGGAPVLRGFTFSYASAQKAAFDKLAIAIANSFEPSGAIAPAPLPSPAPPSGTAIAVPTPAIPVLKLVVSATGVLFGGNRVLVSLPASGCTDPVAGKSAARLVKTDKPTGMSVLEISGGTAPSLTMTSAKAGEVVVVYFDGAVAGAANASSGLLATTGEVLDLPAPRLKASLQGGLTGGVVFDRTGAFAGLVQPLPPANNGGPASYALTSAATALAFAGATGTSGSGQPQTTGSIVAGAKMALVPVLCTK